ncbi:MAG: hypothetical protein LRY53_02285 [Burkholderiaceae bacterium]|nr:hypothetical protein [Burkholderiaceae bacterium]MCD8537080.1 hypothetical protein [Burkholderiaceae bacterium]MCD8564490.1 hypothetical protein [Burkholderiaceae bacterium]
MCELFKYRTVVAFLFVMPTASFAHDGHGNTPLHALMHMLEANGVWIGLMLLLGVGSLLYQAKKSRINKSRCVRQRDITRERRDDSR